VDGTIYYNPEQLGLKVFAEISNLALDYEFSMFIVWQDAEGNLFYGEDSGCSCPEPFQDVTGVEDLNTIIGADGLQAFFDALTSWGKNNSTDTYGDMCTVETTYVRRKVREYMTR
jgi:hypothetical protein